MRYRVTAQHEARLRYIADKATGETVSNWVKKREVYLKRLQCSDLQAERVKKAIPGMILKKETCGDITCWTCRVDLGGIENEGPYEFVCRCNRSLAALGLRIEDPYIYNGSYLGVIRPLEAI